MQMLLLKRSGAHEPKIIALSAWADLTAESNILTIALSGIDDIGDSCVSYLKVGDLISVFWVINEWIAVALDSCNSIITLYFCLVDRIKLVPAAQGIF